MVARLLLLVLAVMLLAHTPAEAQRKQVSRRIPRARRDARRGVGFGLENPATVVLTAPAAQQPGELPADTTPTAAVDPAAAAAAPAPQPGDRGFVETAVPGLPTGFATAAVTSACGWSYFQTDLRPLRMQWNSSAGFCGETSMQMIALARGVWISQRQARVLSNVNNKFDDVILNSRAVTSANIYPLLRNKLAWNVEPADYWDDSNQTLSTTKVLRPPASTFLGWVKGSIMAGKPVITAVRLQDASPPDAYYDHIVPLWGTCTQSTAPTTVLINATDVLSMTTNLKDETNRSASDPGLYAKWKACPYAYDRGEVGCIPQDSYDYGLAMGDIKDTAKLTLRTTRLFIDGWSDGSDKAQEPGEASAAAGNSVTAKYTLLVWGLTVGQQYKVYRLSGARTTIPTTKSALSTACGTACKSVVFTATASSVTLKETSALGAFPANSVQYFFTVTYP